jgi:cytokinin dehydrogenase
VAATIRWAAQRGHSFAAQGQRHSVFGRSMASDGIVADMSRMRTVRDIQRDRVTADAGATWHEVVAATLPHGLTPPVLTEYLGLSVGGTLVVGGVGAATARFGLQSDNVVSMDVVTGTGQEISCSADSNPDLFDTIRAGLGQVAIIIRATLLLVPAPQNVRRYVLSYPDLRTMVRDQRLLAAESRFDAVLGAVVVSQDGTWQYRLDAMKHVSGGPQEDTALLADLSDLPAKRQVSSLVYSDYINRLAVLEATLRKNGQWFLPHPWLTMFVGDSHVEAVVANELARLKAADLGPFGQIGLSAFQRRAITSPLLRLPSDDLCYAFNLIRIPTTNSAAEVIRLIDDNRAIYTRLRAAGGTLYPVSAFPMSHGDWRQHFGPTFSRLREAKQKFDPDHVLTPGYRIF